MFRMRRSQLTSKCLVACLTTVLFTPLSAKTKTVLTAAGNEMSVKGQNLAQSDSSERYLILTGIIVDTYGEPVPGATVMVKSTRQGTISDVNGHFSIRVKKGDILNISFIGMITQTFVYEGQNNTMITLKENVAEMEEVVVTGTFTRKANTYTGSVTTVSHEKLQSVGNSNIISSLKSIDPSFMIMDNLDLGSNPNALPDIQMRGQTGFSDVVSGQTNPNQPLFILDGFETTLTKILDLDMNLVQSVTLLKDATAKAMYGAKAGNGVIVVETKRPEEGKMRVSYNGNLSVEMPDLTSYNLCNIS